MFSTHVTSVCFVRNDGGVSEHGVVTLTPFLRFLFCLSSYVTLWVDATVANVAT